jgi:hypothetical protein
MFTSEEPTRFALSCTGSRAMAGVLSADVSSLQAIADSACLLPSTAMRRIACACADTGQEEGRERHRLSSGVWSLTQACPGSGRTHGLPPLIALSGLVLLRFHV